MIGFETIGNATATFFENGPVLSTDPWIIGNPYFGSWAHKYIIPKTQLNNIIKSKYIFLSHGHPDHIDPDSLELFKNSIFLIADHYGDRIYNDLNKNFNCIKLKSNTWFEISKNIRIKTFSDWNQDSSILIEVLKSNIVFNLNDGNALGWSNEIKKIISKYKNRFLLKLVNWGDADMINFYDANNHFIDPYASNKYPCGKIYNQALSFWDCNYAIPFSSLHKYNRSDSIKMNKYITPIEAHGNKFDEKNGILLPAFIQWDFEKNNYKKISPSINNEAHKDPIDFGDNWSDPLDKYDEEKIFKYFNRFYKLKEKFGFINFCVGGKDFNIKLSNLKPGIKFETPRNSLITAIDNNIFDDILIGNFAKVQLIDVPSLYPDFTPYVTKYGDNGNSRSQKELKKYFNYYRLNSVNFWSEFLKIKSAEIIRQKLNNHNKIKKIAKKIKSIFVH